MREYKGVHLPVALRDLVEQDIEYYWWKAGVESALETFPPFEGYTQQQREVAAAHIIVTLLTFHIDHDNPEMATEQARLAAEQILKVLMPDAQE